MKKDAKYLHQNMRICSDHFEDGIFTNSSKETLTSDAAPTLLKYQILHHKLAKNDDYYIGRKTQDAVSVHI